MILVSKDSSSLLDNQGVTATVSLSSSTYLYSINSNHNITGINISFGKVVFGLSLCCLNMTTIFGNMLVIVAVVTHRQLRSITNFFIVSLACADLLMGIIVMPFGVYTELSNGAWPFGRHWCDLWHAFDILSSTASILHLCMIALERFWATRSPLTYGISRKRCAVMICIAWMLSGLISLPAIAWWHAMEDNKNKIKNRNNKLSFVNGTFVINGSIGTTAPVMGRHLVCIFPDDKVYILLSSSVSFYIPLVVMIFVYFRIYRTATRVMKSLSAGTKVVYKDAQSGEVHRLGVHRGGMTNNHNQNNHQQQQQLQHSYTKSDTITSDKDFNKSDNIIKKKSFLCFRYQVHKVTNLDNGLKVLFDRRYSPVHLVSSSEPSTFSSPSFQAITTQSTEASSAATKQSYRFTSPVIKLFTRHHRQQKQQQHQFQQKVLKKKKKKKHMYKKTISISMGRKFTKFATEQKAAKTLGIVMGIFIICWLPFFICNVLSATYPSAFGAHKALVMTIVTWLGYLNSAINPMIYAHSLRDFRRAFIRIMCCFCIRVGSGAHGDWTTMGNSLGVSFIGSNRYTAANPTVGCGSSTPSSSFKTRSKYYRSRPYL